MHLSPPTLLSIPLPSPRTCPAVRVLAAHVGIVPQQHPDRLQVAQRDGQLQGGPAPWVNQLDVMLHGKQGFHKLHATGPKLDLRAVGKGPAQPAETPEVASPWDLMPISVVSPLPGASPSYSLMVPWAGGKEGGYIPASSIPLSMSIAWL